MSPPIHDMEFDVVIEEDEDGIFVASVPVLPGCHTQGNSKAQALERIREAIVLYLQDGEAPTTRFVSVERVDIAAS